MTTPEAAQEYLSQHLKQLEGREYAIYNPNNSPIESLPVIYGFNNGGYAGWFEGVLLAEDGECVGGHICSDEAYMPHDLGVLEGCRADRHGGFKEKYPQGYRMEFVTHSEVNTNVGLMAAFKLNQKRADKTEEDQFNA